MTVKEQREKLYNDVKNACDKLGYKIVSDKCDFINNQSVIKYLCPVHGIQEKSATGLKQGKHCALCANQTKWINAVNLRSNNNVVRKKYYERAIQVCQEKGYELISAETEFNGYKSYIKYKCPKHGEKIMRYGNLNSGRGCPDCQKENTRKRFAFSQDDVIMQVEGCGGKIFNPDDYINNSTRNLLIECPRCHKNKFYTSLRLFTQHGGQVCRECFKKESNGERLIREWLENHNVKFEQQKWFPDCKDVKPLPFDFYVGDKNSIIEFDGKQHYEDSHYFDHVDTRFHDTLSYIRYHDDLKTNYCAEKGISLLRIPYDEINNIDSLLNKFLLA